MKYFATLLLITLLGYYGFSQKTGSIYLPPQTTETPKWFTIFYSPSFEKTVNVFNLDENAKNYKDALKKLEPVNKSIANILEGEEFDNPYLSYYKRWRKSIDVYVQNDGHIDFRAKENQIKADSLYSLQKKIIQTTTAFENPSANTNMWQSIGPITTSWLKNDVSTQPLCSWQVNIYSCDVAQSNLNVLYAGAETGALYKTTDKGLQWNRILDEPRTGPFTAIAVDPTNENIVYAGRDNIIKKTIDGGVTWVTINTTNGFNSGGTQTIIIDPNNSNNIYAATTNGLYKTADAGTTWTKILNYTCYDVAFKPGQPDSIYTLTKVNNASKFYVSPNAGVTFTQIPWSIDAPLITSDGGSTLTTTLADPNRIYVVVLSTSATPGNSNPYIFKSIDAGLSWTQTAIGSTAALGMNNGQGFYDLDILANPNNADELIVATTTAYRSTNGGTSFIALGGYSGYIPLHPDIQVMIAKNGDSWIGTDGGLNYSTDFFASATNFSSRNTGITGSDFWGFAQGWNEDAIGGGRYHNGNTAMHENYGVGNSIRMGGGEAPTGYYMLGREKYIAYSDIGGKIIPEQFTSLASNFSFTKYPNEDGYGYDASEVEFFPYCYGIIYSGSGNALYKSVDQGITWALVKDFGTNQRVKQFEISRSNPNVIYVSTSQNMFRTADGGNTWATIQNPSGQSAYNRTLALSFTDENTLWITSESNPNDKKVYKTIDGGNTWINATTPTINGYRFRSLILQAGTNNGVYLISRDGRAFYKNDNMSDWQDYSLNLPGGFYPILSKPFYRDAKIRSAGNRGVWEIPFYETSTPIAQPTVDKLVSYCARDTFYFDDYSVLEKTGATWQWSFSGNPIYVSSYTSRNPKVVFGNVGNYSFTLTVQNAAGTSTKTINDEIKILSNLCAPDTVPGKTLSFVNLTTADRDYATQTKPMGFTSNTITLSAWIKPAATQNTAPALIFTTSGTATGLNLVNYNQLAYHWRDQANTYNWRGGPFIPLNEWSHVALVITPTQATVYLNGMPYVNNVTHNTVTFNAPFELGRDRGYTDRMYKGLMDEVCIYNRALSTNEIRELMNLTRNNPNTGSLPNFDPSLIAYYQFNESNAMPTYDKVGSNNLLLIGNTNKDTTSSAPVGGGTFDRESVTTNAEKNFAKTSVTMKFANNATVPNGDIVVTKLNVVPYLLPADSLLPKSPYGYYVIRNYGTNLNFTPLTELQFASLTGVNTNLITTPRYIALYKRPSNSMLPWNDAIDSADEVSISNNFGTVKFNTNLNISSFSQFSIADNTQKILLPILTSYFKAKAEFLTKKVLIDWEVTTPQNLSKFVVEKSKNLYDFETLETINANTNINEYSTVDFHPIHGNNYYRLKIIDVNGNISYTPIELVSFSAEEYIKVMPNPSTDGWITIRSFNMAARTKALLQVNNTEGKLIKQSTLFFDNTQTTYKVFIGTSGIYYIRVLFENGDKLTQKIIVTD